MPIQKDRKARIVLSLKLHELTDILQGRLERWDVSARAAALAVSAQVEAEEGVACGF
jgi:hypothetical protein